MVSTTDSTRDPFQADVQAHPDGGVIIGVRIAPDDMDRLAGE